jgi:hypothetical protein
MSPVIDIWFLAEPESQSTGASAESQTQVGQVWLPTCPTFVFIVDNGIVSSQI